MEKGINSEPGLNLGCGFFEFYGKTFLLRRHEMTPVKHKQRFNRSGEDTKENKNFVFSKFRIFVIDPLIQNPKSKIQNR